MKQKNDSFEHTTHKSYLDVLVGTSPEQTDEFTLDKKIIDEAKQQIEDVFLEMVNSEAEEAKKPAKETIYNIVMIISLAITAGLCAFAGVWLSVVSVIMVGAVFMVLKGTLRKKKLYFNAERISFGRFCSVVHNAIIPLGERLNAQARIILDRERIIEEQTAKISQCEDLIKSQAESTRRVEKELEAERGNQAMVSAEKTTILQNVVQNVAESELDLQGDEAFARWLQVFTEYSRKSENSDVRMLYSQLKADLATLGIYIYDELEFDFAGNVKLPDESYFADLRSSDEWGEVILPVIYTKDKVLMRGKIR